MATIWQTAATPMIGQNDVVSEVFYETDAQEVADQFKATQPVIVNLQNAVETLQNSPHQFLFVVGQGRAGLDDHRLALE